MVGDLLSQQIGGNLSAFGPLLAQLLGGGQMPTTGMSQTAGPGGFSGPMAAPSVGTPADAMAEDTESVVTGWKPKKRSTLGFLGDVLLGAFGAPPAFGLRKQQRNMQEAMEGFTQDPLETIRRLGQIPGQQEKALQLYERYVDNKRADDTLARQNRALDMRNDDYLYQMTAGMMGAARPETWSKMRELAIKRAAARGADVSHLIPEEYDADAIEYMRYGAVKPKDQMTLEERERNNKARVGLGYDRLNESVRDHNLRDEDRDDSEQIRNTAEEGRNTRHSTPRPKASGGGGAAQSILPDGSRIVYGGGDKQAAQTAIVIAPDGTKRYLNKLPNGRWKVVAPPSK